MDDIQNTDEDQPIYHIMTQLKPYTQYAVYVKTYTIATERLGAQSDIVYIWTLPGREYNHYCKGFPCAYKIYQLDFCGTY